MKLTSLLLPERIIDTLLFCSSKSNDYFEKLIVSKLSDLSLTELVVDCECSHSQTGSKCVQSVIFSERIGNETQEWQNRTVTRLSLSYGEDCGFWNAGKRQIVSVFPSMEHLTCLKAPLEVPEIDDVLDNAMEINIFSRRGSFSGGSRFFFEKLINKLVTLECTHFPVSSEILEVLQGLKSLKHLKLMIADGAEEGLFSLVACLRTLSICWGPCHMTNEAGARGFYSPRRGVLPSLIKSAPNIRKLCWWNVTLPCDDLLTSLKLTGHRLRLLEISLEHQGVCHGQYFLVILKGLSAYSPQLRTVKLGFCCNGRYERCVCGDDISLFKKNLSASVHILSKHVPLLSMRPIYIAKNRIVLNHVLRYT
eukprot:TRINITY_DN95_c0_g1_i2.p1 TRINITY_DN95_c0_g1~~TRINITY_DN95_c0_g1_i2.p1  ORF type:complete len:365 (-),score=21.24 TRINITY_DN95_c0_g1_i2:597-1691(-)